MTYIDLTQSLSHHMPVYPGDRHVELVPVSHGDIVHHDLICSMHSGTHIDAPLHMIPGGKKLSAYPVSKFVAPGVLIDARGKKQIGKELLDGISLPPGCCILFFTGFGELFYTKGYFVDYPAITQELAQSLIDSDISMIGTDTPSPDYAPFNIHTLLLESDILIIENLTLNELARLASDSFEVIALPLKAETDGALARVIARL